MATLPETARPLCWGEGAANFARITTIFLMALALCYPVMAQLPRMEGETLAGHPVVLPDAVSGKVAVLVLGFTKASKNPTNAWAAKINQDFGAQVDFQLYQLPVLESVPRFVRGFVISSMRKDVPANRQNSFVPLLHGEAELKKFVNYKEPQDAYLIVLDTSGRVVQQRHGAFDETSYGQLRDEIRSLLK